ncbi:hypothetical protein Patl1_22911 [Pistacia atlantica]|uniref:Uncharacterized protein n=1 Tax=Pistacia atlantica TaxID=434234 RepID=A0ACC0ZYM7_9ROSI|nr:hypothetical protein Patl1_22911 [Pistacia atlantica]
MVGLQFPRIAVVLLLQSIVIFSRHSFGFAATKSKGVSIKIIPIDSRESPLYNPNLTHRQKIERMVNVTLAKAKFTTLSSTQNSTFDDDKHFSPIDRQGQYYLAQMLIGNPTQYVYLMVDTGSSLIWTQCQPCENCFHQTYPIYDRRASSTYRGISCDHPNCNHNERGSLFQCVDGNCAYSIQYGHEGFMSGPTKGFASFESFTFLVNDNGDTQTFPLLFGCSTNNQRFSFASAQDNKISGILGLDFNPISLASQLSYVFSYCIVPYGDHFPFDVHPHILRFGPDVLIPQNIPTTSYVPIESTDLYYLRLLDISVGGSRLNLPPGTFDPSSHTGFFIDSGAPFPTLTTRSTNGLNVFEMVNTAFSRYYDSQNLERRPAQPGDQFKNCYMIELFINYISMTYHFEGADYEVESRYAHNS